MKIHELPAALADRVIVTFSLAIVPAGTVAEIDFEHETCFFQIAQRVVDGGVTDTRQALSGGFEYIAGRRVIFAFEDHLKHRFPLRGQLVLGSFLCFLRFFHDGFRLILNPGNVKCVGGPLRKRRFCLRKSQKAGI